MKFIFHNSYIRFPFHIENMFKVPTYDELEKKEKELNNESKGFTSSLFFMRKNTNSDDSIEGIFHYKHLALL